MKISHHDSLPTVAAEPNYAIFRQTEIQRAVPSGICTHSPSGLAKMAHCGYLAGMSDGNYDERKSTRSLNQRHTAWYQLASAAGSLLDRFHGEVTDTNRQDLWVLRSCLNRVLELEGMLEGPENRDYDLEISEGER